MKNKIKYSELIEAIADEADVSRQLIHDLLKETSELIENGLVKDGRANIKGLGHFTLKWQNARQGRNPQTGESIEIPAQNKITFKPEFDVRNYINRKYKHLKPKKLKDPNAGSKRKIPALLWGVIPLILLLIIYLLWPT